MQEPAVDHCWELPLATPAIPRDDGGPRDERIYTRGALTEQSAPRQHNESVRPEAYTRAAWSKPTLASTRFQDITLVKHGFSFDPGVELGSWTTSLT